MSAEGGAIGEAQRQEAIDRLCEAFADDRLEVEEFERRLELVHRASIADELTRLLADLPAARPPARREAPGEPAIEGAVAPVPAHRRGRGPALQPAGSVPGVSVVAGILGGATRTGNWRPARTNYAIGIMGGFELDLRDAVLPPGVTEIRVFAMWGGGEIIVPPDVVLDVSAIGIMGGFEEKYYAPADAAPDAPIVRVTGLAIMGGAEIQVRHPGESKGDAKRRLREEKKARKRLGRGGG